jgi:hypothetical protein
VLVSHRLPSSSMGGIHIYYLSKIAESFFCRTSDGLCGGPNCNYSSHVFQSGNTRHGDFRRCGLAAYPKVLASKVATPVHHKNSNQRSPRSRTLTSGPWPTCWAHCWACSDQRQLVSSLYLQRQAIKTGSMATLTGIPIKDKAADYSENGHGNLLVRTPRSSNRH